MKFNYAVRAFVKRMAEQEFEQTIVLPEMLEVNAEVEGYNDDVESYKKNWLKNKIEEMYEVLNNKGDYSNVK